MFWLRSCPATTVRTFSAVVFGAGDFRTRTEDRPLPPPLAPGDRLRARAALGDHRGAARSSAAGRRCASSGPPRRSLGRPRAARPADSVRARADAARAVGRVDADRRRCRSPSSRRRRASRSTGRRSARCASAASRSRRSRSPRASRRPATRRSIGGFRSTSPTGFPTRRRRRSAARDRDGGRIVAVGTTVVRALEHAAARDGVVRAGRRHRGSASGSVQPAARRRCDPLGHARTRQQPLPAAARVPRRRPRWPR